MAGILLIAPYFHSDIGHNRYQSDQENPMPPYGIILLGTLLRDAGHPVRVLDLHRDIIVEHKGDENACLDGVADVLRAMRPDIVGISFFTYLLPEAARIISHVRKTTRQIGIEPIFIAGGIHAIAEPLHTLDMVEVDYVCTGEGEKAFLSLANGADPDTIPGFASRRRLNPEPAIIVENLDELPFLDYSLVDWRFYAAPTGRGFKRDQTTSNLALFFSRGCVFTCNFCAYGVHGRPRYHSADYVIAHMRMLEKRFGIADFQFWDSTLGTNRKLLVEFCEKLIADPSCRHWSWRACMRTNQVDEQLLDLMKKAGCIFLCFGIESASQKDLDRMNKKTRVSDNYAAARMCNKLEIYFSTSLIVNYPGQTAEDFLGIENFLLDTAPPAIGINSYAPLPGSHDFEVLEKKGGKDFDKVDSWRSLVDYSKFGVGVVYADVDRQTMAQWYNRLLFLRDCIACPDNRGGNWRRFKNEWEQCVNELFGTTPVTASPFFQLRGAELTEHWQTCFYGEKESGLRDDDLFVFRPTSAHDHAATDFLRLPERNGNTTQMIHIRLDFPEKDGSNLWHIELQNENYNTLARFECEDNKKCAEFVLPVIGVLNLKKIRLVFSPGDSLSTMFFPENIVLSTNLALDSNEAVTR